MSETNSKKDTKMKEGGESGPKSSAEGNAAEDKKDSDKVKIESEGDTEPFKESEATPKDNAFAVAAMAVAADDGGIEAGGPAKAQGDAEGQKKMDNATTTKDSAAATDDASKSKEEETKKEAHSQSVADAAAEAGLTVVQAPDDSSPLAGASSTAPPLEESPYPYHVNVGKDVISGKGGKVQQYNRHFRNLVAEAYSAYDSTTSKIAKRRIGVAIYTAVIEKGGRFLDAQGKEMDRSKAVLKVMKALKDAKTWTSDAKRAAKERREAKQKEGNEKNPPAKGEKEQDTETKLPPPADPKVPVPSVAPEAPLPATVPVPTEIKTEGEIKEDKAEEKKEDKAEEKAAEEPTTKEENPAEKEEKEEETAKEGTTENLEETVTKEEETTKKAEETTEKTPDEPPAEEATEKESEMEVDPEAEAEPETEEKSDENPTHNDKKSGKSQREPPPPSTRPRRTSKRRVHLPLNGSPPAKTTKKGEEVVDSTNDAVRGLHLLSQATQAMSRDKKSKVDKV